MDLSIPHTRKICKIVLMSPHISISKTMIDRNPDILFIDLYTSLGLVYATCSYFEVPIGALLIDSHQEDKQYIIDVLPAISIYILKSSEVTNSTIVGLTELFKGHSDRYFTSVEGQLSYHSYHSNKSYVSIIDKNAIHIIERVKWI